MLVLVALAHAAAAIGFARFQPAPAEAPQPPITVALIEPPITVPTPEPPAPVPPAPVPPPKPEVSKPAPPKPTPRRVRPAPAKVAPPVPVTQAPTAVSREEPPPAPAAPVAETPAPPVEAPATSPAPARPAESRPAETVAARFDAAYLNNPAPAYPPLSRRMREEGKVMLRVFVTDEGTAGTIELSASSGSARLDAAARNAVSRWRFVPAKQDGRNIDAWVVVPIIFKLEGM